MTRDELIKAQTYVSVVELIGKLLQQESLNVGGNDKHLGRIIINEPWELEALRAALLDIKLTYEKSLAALGVEEDSDESK